MSPLLYCLLISWNCSLPCALSFASTICRKIWKSSRPFPGVTGLCQRHWQNPHPPSMGWVQLPQTNISEFLFDFKPIGPLVMIDHSASKRKLNFEVCMIMDEIYEIFKLYFGHMPLRCFYLTFRTRFHLIHTFEWMLSKNITEQSPWRSLWKIWHQRFGPKATELVRTFTHFQLRLHV